ncbi:MAG: hypothetical protein A2W91_09550 [Bacteroidetes bacterium GWF2_38_335]|nr:MAG: hypothetical protein A2W91_09550 [Bacteroidetes bacterium GWF2_38_335]HBS86187.1 hypothetical protein [Bacteroidales bacterium]
MKIHLKLFLLPALFALICTAGTAQSDSLKFPVSIAFTNNATQLPGSGNLGIIDMPIHPGLTVGTYKSYCAKGKHEWMQTFKLGYFYHHYSQQAIQLYSELIYKLKFTEKFGIETGPGAGYLHSFSNVAVFELNGDGVYEKKPNLGRPQFAFGLKAGIFYLFPGSGKMPVTIFFDYRFWLQTPFVNEYVPMLPYSSIHMGTYIYFNRKK